MLEKDIESRNERIPQDEGGRAEPGSEQQEEAAPTLSEVEQLQQALAECQEALAEWQAKSDEYLDKYRRGAAEFANYRKRIERERQQQRVRTTIEIMRKVLPVLDDMDRAVDNIPPEIADIGWAKGVALIDRKLATLFEQFDVEPIMAIGKPFDPNYHQALMKTDSDEFSEGIVMAQMQKGYMLGDHVLRPSTVSVSSGPGPRGEDSAGEQ